jgi:hypothetical protein
VLKPCASDVGSNMKISRLNISFVFLRTECMLETSSAMSRKDVDDSSHARYTSHANFVPSLISVSNVSEGVSRGDHILFLTDCDRSAYVIL